MSPTLQVLGRTLKLTGHHTLERDGCEIGVYSSDPGYSPHIHARRTVHTQPNPVTSVDSYVLVQMAPKVEVLAYGPTIEEAEQKVRDQLKAYRVMADELLV